MIECIRSGQEQGHLSAAEAEKLTKAYQDFLGATRSPSEAKALLLDLVQKELEHRKRIGLLAESRRKPLLEELHGFRDASGQADLAVAFRYQHDKMGHEGLFRPSDTDPYAGMSADDLFKSIMSTDVIRRLDLAKWEFRQSYLTGDAVRSSKTLAKVSKRARDVQARMENVQREMRGEKTGDTRAAEIATTYKETAEFLRTEFNRLGGAIGKLDNWGGPQMHNQEALIKVGQAKWVEYMMAPGVLDRDRMLHPLTEKPYTDAQLKEALEYSWLTITTDGMHDKELSMQRTGRGALYSQHADHRFLHYTPDGWIKYAKDFGNPDFHAAMMHHFASMARDIAHMTKFGPNPEAMRNYLKQYVEKQSAMVRPIEQVMAEQAARMKTLAGQLSVPNPEYQQLADKLAAIQIELFRARGDIRGGFSAMKFPPGRDLTPAERAKVQALSIEFQNIMEELRPYHAGEKPLSLEDIAVRLEMQQLAEQMVDPVVFAHADRPQEYARSSLAFTDFIWEHQRGSLNAPLVVKVNLFGGWKLDINNMFGTIRNLNTATKLHSAVLSAVTDTAFGTVRRQLAGMSVQKANPVSVFVDTIKAMVPREEGDARYAARAGVVADASLGAFQAQARMAGALDTRRWTGYLADRVIALQGLSAWTVGGKTAFGLDLMGHMADHAGMAWRDLPQPVRRTLEVGGFSPQTWDQIRRARLDEPKPGATFLRPTEIAEVAGRDLALRYAAMILRETRYAVPETTPTAQAMMLGGTKPGTVGGTIARSFSQFKSFGFTVAMLHGGYVASELGAGRIGSAAAYAGQVLITGALLGAVAMALKDINSGRDPRKVLSEEYFIDPNFWGAAILQAGGLGIYGDFLFSELNRNGGGLSSTIAGPTVDMINDFRNLTIGNVQQKLQGKDTKVGAESVKFARKHLIPQVVFTKLAWERMVMDQLQILMDKDAQSSFRRQITVRNKDYGQQYWWQPGQQSPSRPPDVSRPFQTR